VLVVEWQAIAGDQAGSEEVCIRLPLLGGKSEAVLTEEPAQADATRSFVRYLPLGPVQAIMPWNFPQCRRDVPIRYAAS
jgi:succinate-semialdehyde dehydrogenase/glutarate-semialdehyde dehydrogenase